LRVSFEEEEEGRGQSEREAAPVGSHASARTEGGDDDDDGPLRLSLLFVVVLPPLMIPNDGFMAVAILLVVPKLKPPLAPEKENPFVMVTSVVCVAA